MCIYLCLISRVISTTADCKIYIKKQLYILLKMLPRDTREFLNNKYSWNCHYYLPRNRCFTSHIWERVFDKICNYTVITCYKFYNRSQNLFSIHCARQLRTNILLKHVQRVIVIYILILWHFTRWCTSYQLDIYLLGMMCNNTKYCMQ